jgi:hypothetical protein
MARMLISQLDSKRISKNSVGEIVRIAKVLPRERKHSSSIASMALLSQATRRFHGTPLHIRSFWRGRSAPTTPVLDREQNAGQKHEDIGQDEHHRIDRNRLLGHGCDAVGDSAVGGRSMGQYGGRWS